MSRWQLLITRETVLLERYLRVMGYVKMFGRRSKVKVRNLLVVNRDGLTAQYVEAGESTRRRRLVWAEYRQGILTNLIPFWETILQGLRDAARSFREKPSQESFGQFAEVYKLGRAIVFYTNDLLKVMEAKGWKRDFEKATHWHEKAEIETCRAWDTLKPTLLRIEKQYELKGEEILYYFPRELNLLLAKGTKVPKTMLQSRKRCYVFHLRNGTMIFAVGRNAQVIEARELPKEQISEVHELQGAVASPGYAKGRVRIVNTTAQMHAMKKGEILVSIMTTPRMLPAVQRAAAIVTEEGGITSHAAIVSRELKIPCVIGTKIATTVFKDGDRVEVDAEHGIIRKV